MTKDTKNDSEAIEETQSTAEDITTETQPEEAAEAEQPEQPETEAPSADALLQAEQDKYVRLYAEFVNFRQRTAKEKSETYAVATAAAVEALLPAIDTFALALGTECKDEAYKSGMEKIYAQLTASLDRLGVKEIEAEGKPFDPKFHNAIKQVEDEAFGEGIVCEVFQKGYLLGDRVIRHAMVAVAN